MSLVHNERTKLLATAPNTAANSCVAIDLLTPLAALLYNLGGTRDAFGFSSETDSGRAQGMNKFELFAFVIAPSRC
jgi:hypothetical protein